jgi:uncharacterized membrane protein YfcA
MLTALALLGTGLLAGILGALLGLGGGIFLVPALTLLFHLPLRAAVGTSLVGVIATSAGVAAVAPRGRGANVSLALRLEMATAAGALGGGLLAGFVSTQVLSILFAAVVFGTAGYLLYKARARSGRDGPEQLFRRHYTLRNWPLGLGISSLAGMASGLLGVGGATSNFMVGITAAASVFIYLQRGDVHPLVVVPTALGVFGGAMAGVYVLPRLRATWLRLGLIGLLLIIGVQMLLRGIQG